MASGDALPSRVFHAMNAAMTRRHAFFAALCLGLAACDSSDGGRMPVNLFECDAGEAAVRHLISKLPELNPGVAQSYSIVLGEVNRDGMTPASDEFSGRFSDLKLKFVNALNLKDIDPDHTIVDPESRLAAFVLQLRTLKQKSATSWEAEVGWSYKKEFGRLKVQIDTQDGKLAAVSSSPVS
jgi:hypothetical protein